MAGLLGDVNPPQGTGLLGGIEDYLLNNNNSLMGFGMGLLSGDTGAAMQGYMQGQRQDFARRQMIAKENEELQKRTAAESIASKIGIDPQVAKADPDGVLTAYRALQVQKMTPREPTEFERLTAGMDPEMVQKAKLAKLGLTGGEEKWEIKTIKNSDGSETPVYFNSRTMETRPVPGFGTGQSRAAQAEAQTKQAADIVVQDIDRALDLTDKGKVKVLGYDTGFNTVTGGAGQVLSNVGGTAAKDVAALTDTIKANATFDKLQQMRKASPTGAALGAVSDTENKLLGAAIGSLEQSQSQEQFTRNLKRVKKIYNEIIHGPGAADDEGNLKTETARKAVQGRGTTRSGVNWSVD